VRAQLSAHAAADTARARRPRGVSRVSALVHKLRHPVIDSSLLEAVKGDMTPGSSALVLLSAEARIDQVVTAFQGQAMELMRSDLSVQQQDQLRAAFSGATDVSSKPPGDAAD